MRIGVVAPSTRIEPETAARVKALADALYPGRVDLIIHPQCFMSWRHFAGEDAARAAAFVELANDPGIDAVWFARGGYGAGRVAAKILGALNEAARAKTYLGYSDAGFLLAGLYKAGIGRVAHGPLLNDLLRQGGDAAVTRALAFLVEDDANAFEPNVGESPAAAFNLTVFSHLLGTALEPDLSGHVLMLEDVSEHMYRIDRAFFHVLNTQSVQRIAGLRLGRVSDVIENYPPFGADEEEIARFWCERASVPYLGRADIGHDVDNKVVVFGQPR